MARKRTINRLIEDFFIGRTSCSCDFCGCYNKIIIVLLAILPIHSLSFCDNSPNGDTSATSACLAKLCTFSGTVQRIVQCWKSLDSTIEWTKSNVSLWSSVPTIKTAFVSDSFPPWNETIRFNFNFYEWKETYFSMSMLQNIFHPLLCSFSINGWNLFWESWKRVLYAQISSIIVQNYDVWAVTKTSCKFLLNLSTNLSFHNFGENMYIEAK